MRVCVHTISPSPSHSCALAVWAPFSLALPVFNLMCRACIFTLSPLILLLPQFGFLMRYFTLTIVAEFDFVFVIMRNPSLSCVSVLVFGCLCSCNCRPFCLSLSRSLHVCICVCILVFFSPVISLVFSTSLCSSHFCLCLCDRACSPITYHMCCDTIAFAQVFVKGAVAVVALVLR